MKQSKLERIIKLASLGIYLAAITFSPVCLAKDDETPPSVSVGVYARHAGDNIMYHYHVNNNAEQNIAALTIGRNGSDDNPVNDTLNLLELPSGWNLKFGIPASSYNAPNGWRANLITYDEETLETETMPHAIRWESLNDRSPLILPGQSSSRFSVTLDKADNNHLAGHALVYFDEGLPNNISVPIALLDVTPPNLTVSLSPNTLLSQSEFPVAIKAAFTVQDDYDSMPQIKLESITADEPLDADNILDATLGLDDRYFKLRTNLQGSTIRIYTVYYSATDASGNQALSSATVTVAALGPSAETATAPAPEHAQEQEPSVQQNNTLAPR